MCLLGAASMLASGQSFRSTLVLSPYSLAFGEVTVRKTTDAQTITLLNSGPTKVQIDRITISGPFTEKNNCPMAPATLGQNQTCGVEVSFVPSAPGRASGSVSVFHDGSANPLEVALAGAGTLEVAAPEFSPGSVNFDEQSVGVSSSPQTVTLKNAGKRALVVATVSSEGDFSILPTSTCASLSSPLAPSGSCTIVVTFAPLGTGKRQGSIAVQDDAANSPQRIPLSGSGREP